MSNQPTPKWERYLVHRQAKPEEWDNRTTHKRTKGKRADSQYNPHLFSTDESIRELETKCMREGTQIESSTDKILKKYMRVPGITVGACRGMDTEYVFARATMDGSYHGRPISEIALREMGVNI
jgi:hypothetical protein